MAFLQEPEPQRGTRLPVLPGIGRIVARNPGIMTYHGTNTYLIDEADGLTIIDPGPPDPQHVADIRAAAGETKIARIVLTHSHFDHMGAAEALKAATSAPVYGFRTSGLPGYNPDIPLDDGGEVTGLTALHTPGHASDHLCFQYVVRDGSKILFSGDHVMSWSSSIVSPPEGDMLAYYNSLRRVMSRDDAFYLPGHGPKLPKPQDLAAELLAHREKREHAIIAALKRQDWNVAALAHELYAKTDPALKIAATRNVLAHMLKLTAEHKATELPPDTKFHPDIASLPDRPEGPLPDGITLASVSKSRTDTLRRFGLARV